MSEEFIKASFRKWMRRQLTDEGVLWVSKYVAVMRNVNDLLSELRRIADEELAEYLRRVESNV